MKAILNIIRVDPATKIITKMKFTASGNGPTTRNVKRVLRAEKVGWRDLLMIQDQSLVDAGAEITGTMLMVAGGLSVDEGMKGWRLKGCEDTAGIGMLFGKGPTGGMTDCPVDVAWVERRIVWLDGEDPAAMQQRAEEMLTMMPADVRAAIAAADDAGPFSDGDTTLWIASSAQDLFGAALTLGLTDEASGGQRLTRLGGLVHGMITGEAA